MVLMDDVHSMLDGVRSACMRLPRDFHAHTRSPTATLARAVPPGPRRVDTVAGEACHRGCSRLSTAVFTSALMAGGRWPTPCIAARLAYIDSLTSPIDGYAAPLVQQDCANALSKTGGKLSCVFIDTRPA